MSFFTKNPNGQTMTPSSPSPTRTTHTQSPSMIITGTSGKQYSLDNNTVNWVKSRYKQDMAGSYGLDDADQLAKRNGQLSASALKTYKNSNVDRQLAELGLPSKKNLEKYLESYNQWHTGGMDQYFSQMNLPKNYWTNVKGWYQSDMQNAYENTAEDQQRKARGLMPSKWESKYTDTEIDDQLRARGLPPISEFNTYRDRWNNYTGIESLYANVAGAQTFLKLNNIKNDDTEYDDGNGGKVKGKDLYTAAFYDELERLDENGNQVYGSIMPLLKTGSGSGKSVELTGDYATDRANQLAANNKNATGSDDYAGYNAFGYDDYLSKADDYYGRYWKNAQYDDKQTVGQRLDVMTRDADEQAVKSYYDIDYTPSDVDAFIKRYEADYPNNSFEQMVTDMYENGVNEDTIRLAKSIKQKSATQNYSEDGKTGFFDYSNQFVRATEAQRKKNEGTTSFTAAAEASYEKEPSNVKEPELDGGWVFPDKEAEANAQKYKEVQAAADAYYTAEANNDRSALYDATQELRRLGLNTIEDADAWMRNGGATSSEPAPAVVASPTAVKDYFTPVGISQDELGELTTEDAARIVEYYMEENGGWNAKNAADAFSYLRTIGVQDDTVTNTARDMQARYGNLPDVAEETAYEGIENDPAAVTQKGLDDMKASVEAAKERDGNDKAIIDQTKQAIQRLLFDEEGNNLILTNADSVIKAIDTVRNMAFTNPTAVDEALKQLGFSANGWFSGVADSLTNGWNTDELVKLRLALGENYSVDASPEEQIPDDARYIQDAFGLSDFWTGNPIASSKKTLRRDFDYALEWAQQQIASGTLTAGQAYNILAADGYQDEMEEYMPEEWHEAHFIEYTAPMLWNQSLAEDQLLWEEMTPEQRTDSAKLMWGNLTPEQKASMYKPGWWKFDDTVNRTPGQAWGQQAAAILPGLITQFVATPVTIADAIDAAITGRPEMWDLTQKLTATEEALTNYGSVDEFSFGTRSAEWVTTAAQELFKMEILGNIGGMVGEAFTGTGVGSKVLKAAASDSKLVSKLADMLMGAVQASPFVAESFAGHYREAKMRGATNGEAAFYGALTGLSEGFIEGANFDKVWGKAIGADRIAENLLQGGLDYLKMGLNGKAFVSSLALGFLGEGTEELVGYAVETGTKMAFYDDTWAKGTEWSWAEAGEQALVGGILGALGSGLHGGSLTTERIITDYAMHNSDAFAQVFPDLTMAIGITESMPEGVRAKYENGGATIMSETAYGQVLDQIANCDEGIRAAADEMKTIEAKLTKNVDTAQAEVDKLAAKLAPYVAKLQEGTLTGKEANEEYAPLQVKYEKAVGNLENAKKVADATQNEQWQQARTRRDNAESQRNTLQKQVQEHWAGIYYANYDNIISGLTDEMVSNIMKAYQKGAAYDPDEQAAKRAETAQTKRAEAEANETIEEATKAAPTPEGAATMAREMAYDRVYKDHEAGKAYAEDGGKSDSKLTPVQFAENERQNFQAKTTAKLRRVTLELAGLEAKEGMSAKEIFEEAKKAMTPEAAQKLDMYQKLSKALGLNMVVRDVVAGTSGYVHDGKLYVTLNGKQSMLRVAAHELTHYMKGHAETQYDALRTSLVNEVGQEKFDELLAEKAQEYGLDLNDAKARLEADDEVCAELCEKMLENPDALERFVQSDLDAAKTLKQRLAKTLVAIKSAIRSIGTSDAETKADLIKQQDTIEQWYKGLSDAIDNANKAGKATATTEAETATVADTTTEAPPVDTNPDLFMGEESARREQLRSELEELAKKGTKVQDVSRQEINDVLDRVILGDKSNYNKADYAQIRGMLAQLIPEVTAYVNGDATVDANVLNERLSAAIDYMLERYGEGSEDYYNLRDLIPSKIALTDTAYKDLRAKDMTLRQASNELTKALGGKFVNFVYKKAPSYNNAMTIDELWQTITDQYGEQNGVGNIGEDALALIDYVRERADNRTSFNDLYGSQREDMVNTQVGEFLDAVQSMVEGKAAETAALHSLDDDYMPLAEMYDAGVATEEETDRLRNIVAFAASQAGYEREAYHGTRSGPFTVFDRNLSGQNYGGYNAAGGGFDFTDTEDWARRWGAKANGNGDVRTVHAYLNTGKPFYSYDGAVDPSLEKYLPYTMTETEKENAMKSGAAFHKALEDNGVDFYDVMMREGYGSYSMYDGADNVSVYNPSQIKSADLVTYDDDGNIIPLSERFNPNETDIRWTVDDDLADLVNQYGAIEQGREPRVRDVQVPRQSADNMRVSKLTRSIEESSKVTDAQAAEIASEIGSEADRVKQLWSYIPKSNDETMRKAKEFIAARQPATAQREFHDMVVAGKYGTRTAAIGLQLLSDASARDDWASVKDIAYDLRVLATEAGQSAQIFNVLKDLKGVGSAWYVEKLVNSLNSTYADEIASGQMDPITVSEEAMQKVREAKTQAEVDAAEKAVADEIGPQLPLKRDEKLSNWRYLSMLGNPVTHIRNVTGNKLMHLMGGIKDVVASGIQRIFESTGITDEGDRTYAYLSRADKAYWDKFAQESYDEQKRNLQGGGKLGFQSLVQQSKRSFDNKVLDTIARGKDPGTMSERKGLVGLLQNIRNNGAMGMLEVEDAWGLEKNYKRSLMEYMKAQGYSLNDEGKVGKVGKDGSFTEITNEQMNKAIEWATNQAWTNTFRGPSALATELNKISKMNTASKLIVEGVMPFKKTPINIAKQGAMYSPAGIVIGTTELLTKVKQGKMSAATAIDHLSSGLTGTALMALGVVLAKAGILRGGGEDKKKLETYLEDTGDQTYAFKFGNVSINMSAIAPATIPLFMGVALQEMLSRNGEDEGVDLSTITDVLAGTLNPFMEMSFMSSLNSALKNYNNEGIGGALGSTIMTAAQNYGSQYLPTLGGKVAQFIDPTQRTTKSSATSPVGGNMDYYWRSLVKKVPGAEATLQPDVNIWGQTTTKDSFGDWALDFANKFILPTNVKVTNRDAVDNELIRVVESTGIADFLPSDGNKYFTVKGEKYKMNASQYTEYSKDRGQAAYAALKDVMAGASYKNATDEQKAELLKKALDNAYKSVNNVWKEKLGAYDK